MTTAVEAYFAHLGQVRASDGATGERPSYGPLANLLNAAGASLEPKVVSRYRLLRSRRCPVP